MNENGLLRVARREPVVSQVHRALRQAVLSRRFEPGARLIETELAEQLGVSRTPVREALSKLEAEGLVESQPAGGMVVLDLEAELVEIYGLRQRLEGYAAYLAAIRATEAELEAIDAVRLQALDGVDRLSLKERAALNNEFHRLLIEASHSPRLIRLSSGYRDYFLNQRMLQFYDRDTALRHHEQHARIVEALRARDPDGAERELRAHFQSAVTVIQSSLGESERLSFQVEDTEG
jgi:DNA-binding GntR family transcriptional regulator